MLNYRNRRTFNLVRFVQDYVEATLLIMVLGTLIVNFFVCLVLAVYVGETREQIKVLEFLRGKPTESEKVIYGAAIIRALVAEPEKGQVPLLAIIRKSSDAGTYVSMVEKQEKIIREILKGNTEVRAPYEIDYFGFDDWFKWFFICAFLIMGIALPFEYLAITYQEREHPLELPWSKPWVYCVILMCLPGIAIISPVWIVALLKKNPKAFPRRFGNPQTIEEAPGGIKHTTGGATSSASSYEERKAIFHRRCQEVQAQLEVSKKRWVSVDRKYQETKLASAAKEGEQLRSEVSRNGQSIQRLQREIAENKTLVESLGASLKAMNGSIGTNGQEAQDFEKILSWPSIAAMLVESDGTVCVFTNPIIIPYREKRYDVGSFEITLSENGAMRIYNHRSTHPSGSHHPHQEKDRTWPHWCNINPWLQNWKAQGDYATVIARIIAGLHAVDDSNSAPGGHIIEWKEVPND